jgi:xylulose-5-phosphate/fructose-6-phosphate phosphoketolase
VAGAHVKENLRNQQIECRHYAHEHGLDRPSDRDWKWPQ